jgi:hypothetical protein
VFYARTVSGLFFLVAALVLAASRGRSLEKTYSLLAAVAIAAVVAVAGQDMQERSAGSVRGAEGIIDDARASKSVASLFLGELPGRIAITVGGTAVYGLPFWRVPQDVLVNEVLNNCGSLFAQLFTALPFLVGMVFFVRRPSLLG